MSTRSRTAPALLLIFLAGCATWRPAGPAEHRVVLAERPSVVRVTRAGTPALILQRPAIARDSIVGAAGFNVTRVALSDVQLLEVQRISPIRTAALVAAQAGAIVSVLALIIEFLPHY